MISAKDLKDVDVVFFSAFDHNEGKDAHGLFQMFKFFKHFVNTNSIFITSAGSKFKNDIDVFDYSSLGGNLKLAQQINYDFVENKNTLLWANNFTDIELYTKYVSDILIKNLPQHKYIAIADKSEIELPILEIILKHFNSKVIILSGVHNTWTGYCSYPAEFNCDKFKTKDGCCLPCPAIKNNKFNFNRIKTNFDNTREFINRNKHKVLLNVGSLYSLQQANESYLFKDVEKCLITLKNSFSLEKFDNLWEVKKNNRNSLIDKMQLPNDKYFIIMWSAQRYNQSRKGFKYFLNSIEILKYYLRSERYKEVILIISGKYDEKINELLKDIQCNVIITGHIDKEEYDYYLSCSDVYCSTTVADAGPRTIYESAANGTPVISFDKCIASDLINENNGALVPVYDVKVMAEELYRFSNYSDEEKREMSLNIYNDYNTHMDNEKTATQWNNFLKKHEV